MDADASFDTRAFREALGWFPTGVAVMTAACRRKRPYRHHRQFLYLGVAGSAFGAVVHGPPLAPPSRFCAARPASRSASWVPGRKRCRRGWRGPGEHSLDGIALMETELGPPALADSLAVFECARESEHGSRRSRHPDRARVAFFPARTSRRAAGLFPGKLRRTRPERAAGWHPRPAQHRHGIDRPVLDRGQDLQDLAWDEPVLHRLVAPELAVAEQQIAAGELGDVGFLGDPHDGQPANVQRLERGFA